MIRDQRKATTVQKKYCEEFKGKLSWRLYYIERKWKETRNQWKIREKEKEKETQTFDEDELRDLRMRDEC